jgi:hypothetical protein
MFETVVSLTNAWAFNITGRTWVPFGLPINNIPSLPSAQTPSKTQTTPIQRDSFAFVFNSSGAGYLFGGVNQYIQASQGSYSPYQGSK